MTMKRAALAAALALAAVGAMGCHLTEVLKVPPPLGEASSDGIQNQNGAEEVFDGAKFSMYSSFDGATYQGVLAWSEVLTDEMTQAAFSQSYYANQTNMDARIVTGPGYPNYSNQALSPWQNILIARSSLLYSIPLLEKYETGSGASKVGEAYALVAYGELVEAESYCSGTTLSEVKPSGGVQYGVPLTDDSLLGVAITDFDSALAHAAGSDTITNLASVGMARALLDRGQYDAAAAAVAQVPASFVYNVQLEPGGYGNGAPYTFSYYDGAFYNGGATITMSNSEGENGLNYISANDPRLQVDSSTSNGDGNKWYLPKKFMVNFSYVPLATGIEAQLIIAEDALHNSQTGTWLADLNALRNSNTGGCADVTNATCTFGTGQVAGQATGLYSLTDPGNTTAEQDLMFRERAFWLYGTGTRLGDLRRLVRQYQRDQSTVYPTGPYVNGNQPNLPAPIPNYGNDVTLSLPTSADISRGFTVSNPNFKGCTTPTTTA